MTHDRLVAFVRTAAHEVFDTMLGAPLEDLEPYQKADAPAPGDGVVALIGMAGAWAGTGTFCCSALTACRISAALLMQEYASVDEEVLDAVGEVTNMVLGNVKSALEEDLGAMGLSIPTVIYGRNFVTRSIAPGNWSVVPFRWQGETLEIHVCLSRSPKAEASRQRCGVVQMLT